jgi:hypothetical protein
MIGEWVITQYLRYYNDMAKPKHSNINLSQFQMFSHKFHMDCSGIKLQSLRYGQVWTPELRHSLKNGGTHQPYTTAVPEIIAPVTRHNINAYGTQSKHRNSPYLNISDF